MYDLFSASQTRWRRPFELILHLKSDDSQNEWKKINRKICFRKKNENNFSALFVSTLVMMHDDPPQRQCVPGLVLKTHVSRWECGSCEGFMLCMSSFIYLFVVFLCRPGDDVAFVYV